MKRTPRPHYNRLAEARPQISVAPLLIPTFQRPGGIKFRETALRSLDLLHDLVDDFCLRCVHTTTCIQACFRVPTFYLSRNSGRLPSSVCIKAIILLYRKEYLIERLIKEQSQHSYFNSSEHDPGKAVSYIRLVSPKQHRQ